MELINDEQFGDQLNELEDAAWQSFKTVVETFLGKRKTENYRGE
jgi:hypothetical protein